MSNYPPGVSAGSPRAPWNAPEPPECMVCERRIADADDHADDCPDGHMDGHDIAEADEAEAQEMKMEQHRLEERGEW
jgi:hypothetical protein